MAIPKLLRILLLRISPPCSEITMLVSKGMDTHLSLRERWRLRFHFFLCASCKRFNIQIHEIHNIVHHSFSEENLTSQAFISSASQAILPEEVRRRMEKKITDALNDAS